MSEFAEWADGGDFDEEAFQDAMATALHPNEQDEEILGSYYDSISDELEKEVERSRRERGRPAEISERPEAVRRQQIAAISDPKERAELEALLEERDAPVKANSDEEYEKLWNSLSEDEKEKFRAEARTQIEQEEREEEQRILKFYDDEIARLSDKLDGLEPEEPEPVAN